MQSPLGVTRGLLLVGLLNLGLGCGDDGGTPPPPGIRDAGPRDAFVPPPRDSGPPTDGGPPVDAGDGGGSTLPSCVSEDDDLFTLGMDAQADPRSIAVAANGNGFLVSWEQALEGRTYRIFSQMIPETGAAADVQQLVDGRFGPPARHPAVMRMPSGFVVAWDELDDAQGSIQIKTRMLSEEGLPTAAAATLTTGPNVHDTPTLVSDGTTFLAGFVTDNTMGQRSGGTLRMSAMGTAEGTLFEHDFPETQVSVPIVASRAEDGYGYFFLNAQAGGSQGAVIGQPLLTSGGTDGPTETVNGSGQGRGGLAAATATDPDIAVVYDVDISGGARSDIRFRRVATSTGRPIGTEQNITGGNEQGTFPGVAPFAGGFVLGFRGLQRDAESARIRIALVDPLGNISTFAEYGDETNVDGGPVNITTAPFGSMLVTWASPTDDGGTSFHARRIRCGM